ncbi:alpha/beta hydrolase [Mangrovicella endophytica]|uniref:alpha/beta hydrolase n=1 Tax=Mangrovicella endophytica TaxID=2066697 RepID=UPI000C9E0A59|nr:alpha/beta hydrolase [Mangrovicella endophytica]
MTTDTTTEAPRFLDVGTGEALRRIAYRRLDGHTPSVLWLGGYRSDMRGSKAEALAELCAQRGLGFCRFDYSGHGESGGRFEDGTISRWTEEAMAVARTVTNGPLVIAGSSMGAWIALRLIADLRAAGSGARVRGLLLLAPAPDFTERLIEPRLTDEHRAALERDGLVSQPSDYGGTDIFTRELIEDGRRNRVMEGVIETGCSIHIIQGMMDADVPYSHALDLVSHLPADGVILTLIRDGDHRLSRPQDLDRMKRAIIDLMEGAG